MRALLACVMTAAVIGSTDAIRRKDLLGLDGDLLENESMDLENVPEPQEILSNPYEEKTTGKIIGGEAVTQVPSFMVSLRNPEGSRNRSRHDVSFQHFCGGVLIEDNIVLTAAHCIANGLRQKPIVHIGRLIREGDEDGVEVFHTIDSVIHDRYVRNNHDNDIGLLLMDGKSKSAPIALRREENCFDTGRCGWGGVYGWGYTRDGDATSQSDILQQVSVELVSRRKCRKIYGRTRSRREVITTGMVCAGGPGSDACKNDSGGPLVVSNKLSGIVSWGDDCGKKPGVYASVAAFADNWIDKEVARLRGEAPPPAPAPAPAPSPAPERRECRFIIGRYFPAGCQHWCKGAKCKNK